MFSNDPVNNREPLQLTPEDKVTLLESLIRRKFPLHILGLLTVAVIRPDATHQVFIRYLVR